MIVVLKSNPKVRVTVPHLSKIQLGPLISGNGCGCLIYHYRYIDADVLRQSRDAWVLLPHPDMPISLTRKGAINSTRNRKRALSILKSWLRDNGFRPVPGKGGA